MILSITCPAVNTRENCWEGPIFTGEGKPVVGHLCDSSISPYHPFILSICPCPSLNLSPHLFCHSLTFPLFVSTSDIASPAQGYHTSATQTVYVFVLFTSSRPPQNIKVPFLSCLIAISWPKYSTHSHKHIKPYEHTLPQNVECQLDCITSETDWKNACALSALPPPCPGAN